MLLITFSEMEYVEPDLGRGVNCEKASDSGVRHKKNGNLKYPRAKKKDYRL